MEERSKSNQCGALEQRKTGGFRVTAVVIDGTFNSRVLIDAAGERWLYRSAQLDAITDEGLDQLTANGVALVLDLREAVERDTPRHGVPVHHVPLYRRAEGPPSTGTLREVYHELITHRARARALVRAVAVIADAEGPVLVHCAVGKDRTGLVVALALRAAGVPVPNVLADYALSAREVSTHRSDTVVATLAALTLDDHERRAATELHLHSPPEAMAGALREVDSHGGIDRYLFDNGLSKAQLTRLRVRGRTS